MKEFNFTSKNVELLIAGHTFSVDVSDAAFMKNIQSFGETAIAKSKELNVSGDYAKALNELLDFTNESIDVILGEGSAAIIFEGRSKNFFDALDVLAYISENVNEAISSRSTGKYINRAQARHNNK